jgi:hypothetical protein
VPRSAVGAPAVSHAATASAEAVEVNELLNFLRVERPDAPAGSVGAPTPALVPAPASSTGVPLDAIKGLLYLRIVRIETVKEGSFPAFPCVEVRFEGDSHITQAAHGSNAEYDDGA